MKTAFLAGIVAFASLATYTHTPTLEEQWHDAVSSCSPSDADGCAQALQTVLDAVPKQTKHGVAPKLWFPTGTVFPLVDHDGDGAALTIKQRIILDGAGSVLEVPANTDGIKVGPQAQWSSISDITIRADNNVAEHDGIGIDVQAHGTRLRDVHVVWMGTGVKAYSIDDGGTFRSNVNLVQAWALFIFQPWHEGISLKGGDANAGTFVGVEVIGKAQSTCVKDESFLGNVWVGPHSSTCPGGSVFSGSAQYSTLLGGYSENDSPISTDVRTTTVGGNYVLRALKGDRVGLGKSKLRFEDGNMAVTIPYTPSNAILYATDSTEGGYWVLRRWPSTGHWGWARNGSQVWSPMLWTDGLHPDGPALYSFGSPE